MKCQVIVGLSGLLFGSFSSGYDSNYDLKTAQRYVNFCGAAYCTDPYFKKNTVDDWSCHACKNYPNVEATSFHGNRSDANGFVAYDKEANEILISFAGTDPLSIKNWIADLDFIQTEYPLCSGCQVHSGFYKSYLSVADSIKSLLSRYESEHPGAHLAITGHSLGAAMAAHCTADLVHSGKTVRTVYSYGMPRVGNEEFEKFYTSIVAGTFRVVHLKDPVPHLPPQSFHFHHMPYEVFYKAKYDEWKLCSFEGEDESCSDQYAVDADVVNHLNYLDFDFTSNWIYCEV